MTTRKTGKPTKTEKKPAASKRGQRRRRVTPLWRNRTVLAVLATLAVGSAAGGGVWLWQSGWVAKTAAETKRQIITASARLSFTVQEIMVVGRDIERVLPDTVVLRVVERRALALWQRKGKFSLIDAQGMVIPERRVGRFSRLPVVVGKDAPAHTVELLETLKTQPQLMTRVKAAVWIGGRRWNVRLDNGIDVRLPEDNAVDAWARVAEYQRLHKVLARDVRVLDLRLPDRLIVRPAKSAPPAEKKRGRQT
jgi:cell division protein FtsQ